MSTHQIPYPSDFDVNYHADRQHRRVAEALKRLDPGDILARVDDLIRQEADPTKHVLHGLVLFLMDKAPACDGANLATTSWLLGAFGDALSG